MATLKTELSRSAGAALHYQIARVLRAQIMAGRFSEGAFLPGETQLTAQFGVSRATVRQALRTLEAERLIERRQGAGTRVVYRRPALDQDAVEQHINRIEQVARRTRVEVTGFEWIQVPVSVQIALALPGDACVLKITRVRHAARPLRHIINHIPEIWGRQMRVEQFAQATLIAVLAEIGCPVRRFDDEIGATLADPDLALSLDVAIGAPLVEISRTMYDGVRHPIAHQWTFVPPDRGKLRTSVKSGEW
jgi:GntR family transcriptional regulator